MTKRAFIIHGYDATPNDNWFPWLKRELEATGFRVIVPQMPEADKPTLQKWLSYLQTLVRECDENTYFIGHSLGTITILKFLESLPEDQKAVGAVLVGGFSEPIGSEKLNTFTEKPLDYEKVKSVCKNIIAIHSTDDPAVPYKFAEIIRDKLEAELITLEGAGHINHRSGYFELPKALEAIHKLENRS